MKKTVASLIAGIYLASPWALAEIALTPDSARKMQNVIAGFHQMEESAPALNDADDGSSPLTAEGRKAIIEQIKASPQHKAALALVKANGFDSLEEFFDFVGRVSSASVAYGLETNGVGDMNGDMSAYLENLKQQGLPPEMLAQIEAQMAGAVQMTKDMNSAAKNAKADDVAAIKKHPEILEILDVE